MTLINKIDHSAAQAAQELHNAAREEGSTAAHDLKQAGKSFAHGLKNLAVSAKHKAQAVGDEIKDKVKELEAKADLKEQIKETRALAEKEHARVRSSGDIRFTKNLPSVGASAHQLSTPTPKGFKSDSTRSNPSSPSSISSLSSSAKSSEANFSAKPACNKNTSSCNYKASSGFKQDAKDTTASKSKSNFTTERPLAIADIAPAAAEKSKEFNYSPTPKANIDKKQPLTFSAAPSKPQGQASRMSAPKESLFDSKPIQTSFATGSIAAASSHKPSHKTAIDKLADAPRQPAASQAFNVKTTTTVTAKPASPRTLAAFEKQTAKTGSKQQSMAEAKDASKAAHPGVISLADIGKDAAKKAKHFHYKPTPGALPDPIKKAVAYSAMATKPMGKPRRMPSLKEAHASHAQVPQPGFARKEECKKSPMSQARSSEVASLTPSKRTSESKLITDSKAPLKADAKTTQAFEASPSDALTRVEVVTKKTYLTTDKKPAQGSSAKLTAAAGDTALKSPHYTTETKTFTHGSHGVGEEMGKAAHEIKVGSKNAAKSAAHLGKGAAAAAAGAFDVAADGAKAVAHGAEVAGVKALHGAQAAAKVLGSKAAIAGDVIADDSKHFLKGAKKVLAVAGKKTGSIAADTAAGIAGVAAAAAAGTENMWDKTKHWWSGFKHDISANAKAHKIKARETKATKRALAASAKPAVTTKTIATQAAKPVKQSISVQAKPVTIQAKPVTVQAKPTVSVQSKPVTTRTVTTQKATPTTQTQAVQAQPAVIQTQPIVVETKPAVAVQAKPPTTTTTTTTYKTITEEKRTPVVEAKPVEQKPITTYVQVPVITQPAPVQIIEQQAPQTVTTTRVIEEKAPVVSQAKSITVPVTQTMMPTTQVTAAAPRLYAVAPQISDKKRKSFFKSKHQKKIDPAVQVTRTVETLQHGKMRPVDQDTKFVTMGHAKDVMRSTEHAFYDKRHKSFLQKLGLKK